MVVLMLAFAALMSLPWLVPHMGWTALFGMVPLLCMEKLATDCGMKRFWLWHYSAFVLWNAFTTFWVCNATIGGGVFAVLANSLQMSLVFGLFRLSRKRLSGALPYIFLVVTWIAWERAYFDFQISWPWLVLGNAFGRTVGLAQWYEYTGALGGSLWIWVANLGVFGLMASLSDGAFHRWNAKARSAAVAGAVLAVFAPMVVSGIIWHRYEEVSEGTMDVMVGQPNFDPYQKFQFLSQSQQNAIFEDMIDHELESGGHEGPLLVMAPETFTNDISVGEYDLSPTYHRMLGMLNRHPGTELLMGASSRENIRDGVPTDPNDYVLNDGRRIRTHNSALALKADGSVEIFHKSRLVVGTELAPFPKVTVPLAEMLGTGIGRCVGQPEISLLHFFGVPVGCAVCYESIYGEYCTGYVTKGAKFLTVITNDAWWGNTPGYRQHLSYSALRAIELRRDVARCANTGISCFIDQKGRIVKQSSWWEREVLSGTVHFNSGLTFFARHGDFIGRVCTFVFLILLLSLIVRFIIRK